MLKKIVIKYNLLQLDNVADQIINATKRISVVTLTGSLGAGKTTLVATMLKRLGVIKPVVSPTFTYMNVYQLKDGRIAYHFDLYRLKDLESFEQAGFAEYLYQDNSICLIEWPEIILSLLKKSVGHIEIDFVDLEKRQLVCKVLT